MKYIKIFPLLLSLVLIGMACETEMVDKLDTFTLPNGGYMRTVTPFPALSTTFKVSKKNMGGTKLELVAEAVTPEQGSKFASYELEIRFVGATTTAYKPFRSIPASSYTKDAATGYPRHTLVITGTEAMTAMALDTSKIKTGDKFEVLATMKLTDGQSFSAANSGLNLTGDFYSSPFRYFLNVIE